jgi:cytoskeletal protein CcmA (bactofilin family)
MYKDDKRDRKKKDSGLVILGRTTSFTGILKFDSALKIQGSFRGTIQAVGDLIVDKDAIVEADYITVNSLTVYGSITGTVQALDKVDMMSGAKVHGDVSAARLRIADGVLFEGKCKMTNPSNTGDKKREREEIEIFHRPAEEIRAELQR